MANGNGWDVRKTLVTILVIVVTGFAGLCFTGFFHLDSKLAIAKEANDDDHKEIIRSSDDGDEKIDKQLKEITKTVTKIQLEQRTLITDQRHLGKGQAEIKELLTKIANSR